MRVAPVATSSGLVVAGSADVDLLDPNTGNKIKSFGIWGAFDAIVYGGSLYVLAPGSLAVVGKK